MISPSGTPFPNDFFGGSSSSTSGRDTYGNELESATNSSHDDRELDRKLLQFADDLSREYREKNDNLNSQVEIIKRECERLEYERNTLSGKVQELKDSISGIDRVNIGFVIVASMIVIAGAFALYSFIDGKFDKLNDSITTISNNVSVNSTKTDRINSEVEKMSQISTDLALLKQSVNTINDEMSEITENTKIHNNDINQMKSAMDRYKSK